MNLNFIIDAQLDLAMNAMGWNRDLSRPLEEIRQREMHMKDKPDRGKGTVCFPELREQSHWDMNSNADLQKYQLILSRREYRQEDNDNVFHKNRIRSLRKAWS